MDEKRAIVAVVLIFVVLFGYNFWQRQQAVKQQDGTEVVGEVAQSPVEEVVPTGDGGASSPTTPDAGRDAVETSELEDVEDAPGDGEAVAAAPERTITVDAPLWVATLSSRGGSITSWRLKEYNERLDMKSGTGDPVSLVTEGSRALALTLDYGPTSLAVDDWAFESGSPSHIDLTDGRETAVVRYDATGPDGVAVTREYTFYADTYSFEARVDVSGLKDPSGRRALCPSGSAASLGRRYVLAHGRAPGSERRPCRDRRRHQAPQPRRDRWLPASPESGDAAGGGPHR